MKSVLIDSRAPRAVKDSLTRLGFRVIELPPSRHLPEGISAHPDSLITRLGKSIITYADYCDEAAYVFSDIREFHPDIRISFSSYNTFEEVDLLADAIEQGKKSIIPIKGFRR